MTGMGTQVSGEGESLGQITRTDCRVCGSAHVDVAVDLRGLPLTGVFLDAPNDGQRFRYDQALQVCTTCGHGQLQVCLAPEAVYDQTYFHRSSGSNLARTGNDVFARFLRQVAGTKRYRCLLEIGANDLYLTERVKDLAVDAVAVDPIWKNEPVPPGQSVKVIGKFVEELGEADFPARPDLVVAVQTFEHVDEPHDQLRRILDFAADDALVVLEVPDFDSLLRNLRFDQVFHQHVHYYSLASLKALIARLGCVFVGHSVNYRYWGGALAVAFRKSKARGTPIEGAAPTVALVQARFTEFRRSLGDLARQLGELPCPDVYGFGAAQMLPTLAYHMQTDFSFLNAILDDDARRAGLYYPGIPVPTRAPGPDLDLRESAVLVTAVDSARPILRRVLTLDPQHVLVPFQNL